MVRPEPTEGKLAALRAHHALNPHPEAVTDPAFVAGSDFFDARDLVQVKYEMLRRVGTEGQPVTQAAGAFGFSRPAFYQAQQSFAAEGLPGLLPQRPGPRRAHKLTEEVMAFLQEVRAQEPKVGARELACRLREQLRVSVHPRTIERGLPRRQKNCGEHRHEHPAADTGLAARYEALRAFALGEGIAVAVPHGLALFQHRGMAAWMAAWAQVVVDGPGDHSPSAAGNAGALPGNTRQLQTEVAAVLAGMALAAVGR